MHIREQEEKHAAEGAHMAVKDYLAKNGLVGQFRTLKLFTQTMDSR
jgi:hypothetical protein